MITRHILLVISILCLKDISSSQNDYNNINGGQSQGMLQKSLNQIALNQGLPINLQQILNSRQSGNAQQIENIHNPQGTFQVSPDGMTTKGYHQSLVVQRPSDYPNFNDLQYTMVDGGNQQSVQLNQQQYPAMPSQFFGTPMITSQSFQPAPVLSSPQSYVIESSQSCGNTPHYANNINDPSLSYYSAPQPNYQIVDINQSEFPNQIISKYVQPQSGVITTVNQQPIIGSNQILPSQNSYSAYGQSSAVSGSTNQGSKPSSIRSLLPLIVNLLKERNDGCDCCQNCGCEKNKPQGGEINGKDKRNGVKSKSSKSADNFDDRNDREHRGSSSNRIQGRNRNVKCEDSYEDYDDEDIGYND